MELTACQQSEVKQQYASRVNPVVLVVSNILRLVTKNFIFHDEYRVNIET
jgi:hypothetical protein